jgi:4'-phosphopantetheinyl transferase
MTVYWLVDRAPPDLENAVKLSSAEREAFARCTTPKRRHDWLLGRWTAKRLLYSVLGEKLEILSGADGAPFVPRYPVLGLSISHSGDYAFCAALWDSPIGVDIERIEPRSAIFVEDYFTADEQSLVETAPNYAPTLIWSAKEAALKALHLGLRADTRRVNVNFSLPVGQFSDEWLALTANCGAQGLMQGGWRRMNGFVLTILAPARLWSPSTLTALPKIVPSGEC